MPKSITCQPDLIRFARFFLLVSASVAALSVSPLRAEEAAKGDGTVELAPIDIEGREAGTELPPSYAGGQVARGGRVGVLGDQDIMDVPFSVTSYTEETIRNQQARTLADVVANDPSVRAGYGYGNFSEVFVIRGFPLYGDDISINGLYGLTPRQLAATDMFERVEVLKGANAFLNGTSPGSTGIGGGINLVPKRAGDVPLTRLTATYDSDSQFGGQVDTGMRFGDRKQFGIRINATGRDGETSIDNEDRWLGLGSVALDYRGEKLRLSLDAAYQKTHIDQGRPVVYVAGTSVPDAPDASHNYAPAWSYSTLRDAFAMLQGEYDITDNITAYAGAGARNTHEQGDYASPTVTGADGSASFFSMYVPRKDEALSGQAGLRAKFATGAIGHTLNAGGSALRIENRNSYDFTDSVLGNIYGAPPTTRPAVLAAAGDFDDLPLVSRTTLKSLFVSDTAVFLDDMVHLTVGVRRQSIHQEGFDRTSFARTDDYDESAYTPVFGLVVQPTEEISLYANRIDGLAQGPSAPPGTANVGDIFAPYRSKQYEIGGKLDYHVIGFGLALFQTEQPAGVTDPSTLLFNVDGEQRNRGVELTTFGEPVKGLRLLGGVTFIDAELSGTAGGADDGNDAVGVPNYQVNVGGEWDLPFLPGVTATARLLHTASQYVNTANTLEIPSWTRLDLGARYTLDIRQRPVTLNLAVENVTDENYWASAYGGYLTQGRPLTARVSLSTTF